jgi:MFS family permease
MRAPTYRWWMVAALAVTSTAGYGVLTYAFAVLLVPMQEALGADRTAVTGAQTVSLLAAALAAVPAGRWLDRWGGRALMVGCSVLATLLVLAWSQVNSIPALYAVSFGAGVASAGVLYEAAFASSSPGSAIPGGARRCWRSRSSEALRRRSSCRSLPSWWRHTGGGRRWSCSP